MSINFYFLILLPVYVSIGGYSSLTDYSAANLQMSNPSHPHKVMNKFLANK